MAGKKTTSAKKSTPRKAKETPVLKQKKPVFRTGTWISLLLLAALIGFTYYLKDKAAKAEAAATPLPGEEETFVFVQRR